MAQQAHNRPEYLTRCLGALFKHHPANGPALPLFVSEDREATGGNQVEAIVNDFKGRFQAKAAGPLGGPDVKHMLYRDVGSGGQGMAAGYARLARHYKW